MHGFAPRPGWDYSYIVGEWAMGCRCPGPLFAVLATLIRQRWLAASQPVAGRAKMQLRVVIFALLTGIMSMPAGAFPARTHLASPVPAIDGAPLGTPACSAGVISVDPTPMLRLPVGALLDRPNRGVILGDHSMLVITGNGHALVGFDSTGRERWGQRISPAGTGGVAYFSDVLRNRVGQPVLWDHMLHRLSVLDATGQRRTQRRLGSLPRIRLTDGSRAAQSLTIRGTFADGQLLATTTSDPGAAEGLRDDSVVVFRVDDRGTSHVIGKVLLAQQFQRTDPHWVRNRLPFGRAGHIAVAGSSWFYTDGSRFRIERRSSNGTVTAVLEHNQSRRPVDADAIRRSRLRALAAVDTVMRASLIRALAAMPYPDAMPAYSDLQLDAAGTLWARVGAPDWEPSDWDLYHPVNGHFAHLTLPPNLRVLDIGRQRLLAYHDAPGESALHVYRICRT